MPSVQLAAEAKALNQGHVASHIVACIPAINVPQRGSSERAHMNAF